MATEDGVERCRTEDRELVSTLARLDERWKGIKYRLDKIDSKLDKANELREKVAALDARVKISYGLLTLIVGGLIGLAFKVLGA